MLKIVYLTMDPTQYNVRTKNKTLIFNCIKISI